MLYKTPISPVFKTITLSNRHNIATIATTDVASGIYIMSMHSPANVCVQRFSVAGK